MDAAGAGALPGGEASAATRGGSGPLRLVLPATLTFCSLGSSPQVAGTEPARGAPASHPYPMLETLR